MEREAEEEILSLSVRNRTQENSQEYQIANFAAVEQSQIDSLLSKTELGDETESHSQVLPVGASQSSKPSSSRPPRYNNHRRYLVEGQGSEKKEAKRPVRGGLKTVRFYTRFEDDFDESDMIPGGRV